MNCLICPLNPLASLWSHIGRNPAGSDGVRGCESDLTSGQLTSVDNEDGATVRVSANSAAVCPLRA